jgi:hypothetical protein
MARRKTRIATLVVLALVVVAAAAFGLPKLWRVALEHFNSPTCTVGSFQIDTEQASVAAQMVAAVTTYRPPLPERAAVLALAAALQESKLTNLPPGSGDRDSVGVLQQRPSQGWGGGNPKRLTDVTEATREFLDALVKVQHWRRLPLAQAVQAVQVSADGSAYAVHEDEAQALADALSGKRPAAITCSYSAPTIVAPARVVAQMARDQLGIDTPTAIGRSVRVPGAGWQTTAWFVANADRLGIERVAYAGHVFTREKGWQRAPASRDAVVATMAKVSGG